MECIRTRFKNYTSLQLFLRQKKQLDRKAGGGSISFGSANASMPVEVGVIGTRVLIVDDNCEHARMAERILERDGFAIRTAASGADALEMLAESSADVVLTDIEMPRMDGLQLLREIKSRWSEQPVVMMSALGTVDLAVKAVRNGASDFVEKPLELKRLRDAVAAALRPDAGGPDAQHPDAQHPDTRRQLRPKLDRAEPETRIVGGSALMRALKRLIKQVALTECRVLIQGENGTGKELIANALHAASNRCDKPFVKVNCGALPSTLLESELFGHEKGAFTGATGRRVGRFELADTGTLLLDEIGELPLKSQVRLLRVLQTGEFERLGGTQTIKVDVRVIASTNRDLREMVRSGSFREDLFYRLNVVSLQAPALRDRRDDIPDLVRHMLSRVPEENRIQIPDETMKVLMDRPYSGNVRELENLIERLQVLMPGEVVMPEHLDDPVTATSHEGGARPSHLARPVIYQPGVRYRDRLLQLERMLIIEALEQHEQSKSSAAESLGTDKSFFYRKCRQFGID